MTQEYTYSIGAIENAGDLKTIRSQRTHPDIDSAQRQANGDISAQKRGWELFMPWQKLALPTAATPGWSHNVPINTPKTLNMVVVAHPTSATPDEVTAALAEFLAQGK